jgi:drug/metabolite transporter (DMT)-like permease
MIVGLAGALLAAVCYGFGSILQATAAAESTVTERLDVVILARLVAQWRYVCGLGLDLLGFVAAVVALRTLPLFVVQAAVASSVGVTALAASRLLHARISRRERRALAGLVVGLVLLAAAGRPEHATGLAEPGPVLLLVGAVVLAVMALALTRSSGERAAALLAAGAGAAFGAVGVAARAFSVPRHWAHALGDPLLYAMIVHGLLATFLFAGALQRGKVTTVAAVTFSVETIVPAVVGIAWLGDRARTGMAPVAALGFGLTVAASISLARFVEPITTTTSPT